MKVFVSEHVKSFAMELYDIKQELQLIRQKIVSTAVDNSVELDADLPVDTVADFQNLNSEIRVEEKFNSFVSTPL